MTRRCSASLYYIPVKWKLYSLLFQDGQINISMNFPNILEIYSPCLQFEVFSQVVVVTQTYTNSVVFYERRAASDVLQNGTERNWMRYTTRDMGHVSILWILGTNTFFMMLLEVRAVAGRFDLRWAWWSWFLERARCASKVANDLKKFAYPSKIWNDFHHPSSLRVTSTATSLSILS